MVLERANSAFSLVLAMHIWWDKLEFFVPLEGNCFFVCHAGLVVENLEVHQKTPGCQACHNGIVGCNAMAVTFGLECLLEDEIAVETQNFQLVWHYSVMEKFGHASLSHLVIGVA